METVCCYETSIDFQRTSWRYISLSSPRDLWLNADDLRLASYVIFLTGQGLGRKKLNKDEAKWSSEPLIWYKDLASLLSQSPSWVFLIVSIVSQTVKWRWICYTGQAGSDNNPSPQLGKADC
jgi:hypothetical protein